METPTTKKNEQPRTSVVDRTALEKQRVIQPRKEIGSTGLIQWGGTVDEEFLKLLRGPRAVKAYREMRDNDAVVGALIYLIDLVVRQVAWRFVPKDESPEAGRAAELAQTSLEQMSFTWRDTLSEILSFLVYGWAYHEVVYKKRVDGLLGWAKWAIRGQDTLERWTFDEEGGIQAMVQVAPPRYRSTPIPIDKALLFRTRIERNNPQGRSILRSAYRTWYMKRRIEEIEGIGIERDLAGIPVLTPPEGLDLWNTNDAAAVSKRQEAEKVVRNIRRDQHEGIVKPFGWDLTLLTTGGRRQFDLNQTLNRMDTRIAMTALAEFLMLGTQTVGSFALSSSKTELFSLATGSYLDIIADVVDRHATPKLLEVNGMPAELAPKLMHGDIETVSLGDVAETLSKLAGAGASIFPNENLERHLMTMMGLPYEPEGQDET